jgi:D-methionine transport system ATP-binding protein
MNRAWYILPMIHLNNISKSYNGLHALSNIDLQVNAGEIFGIIGGSGAGKSTLLRCVNLLETPSSGTVTVDGKNLTDLPTDELRLARHQIGMIFQHFNLIHSARVFDNIALPLRLVGQYQAKIAKRVHELLELVDLQHHANAYPDTLSGGQKQRVAIARALANNPNILLSDEATSALDPNTTQSILSLLQSINQKLGITILLITHEMDVIKQICHRVAVLDQGRIIEEGKVLEIFTQPKHAITKSFVAKCMGESLPQSLASKIKPVAQSSQDQPLLHLAFRGSAAVEPLVAGLVKHCDVMVNILQAHLETIQDEACGSMILSLEDASKCDRAVAYLKELGVYVEVLGYVPAA